MPQQLVTVKHQQYSLDSLECRGSSFITMRRDKFTYLKKAPIIYRDHGSGDTLKLEIQQLTEVKHQSYALDSMECYMIVHL